MSKASTYSKARRGRGIAAGALAAVLACGCAQGALETASLAPVADTPPLASAEPAAAMPAAAASAAALPAPVAEARALRAKGDKAKALAHLDQAAGTAPKDKAILKERGMLALELGQVKKAEDYLRKAHDPASPDWRLHSALGSALAASGRHGDAQIQFGKALEIAPEHPSILNNLALSYALEGKHEEAERLLRKVASRGDAAPKAQQNLALIMDLKGKPLPAGALAANVAGRPDASPGVAGEAATVSRAVEPKPATDADSVADLQARAFGPAN